MYRYTMPFILTVMLMVPSVSSIAQDNQAEELMKRSHLALYYANEDGIAEVKMSIVNSRGKVRSREFTMLRLDAEEGGKQYYYTYFRQPHDVSRLTFTVHKMPFATDNRWLYVPAVDLIKRIAADDKTASFVGSDFSYEDVSGRHWTEDNHTLLREETLGDRPVYVVESVPKEPYSGFARKVSYIDREHFLPLKEEYYDKKGVLARVFTAQTVQVIDGTPTATVRKMQDVKKGQHTIVEFSGVAYNIGVEEDIFTERYLKNPPREFIK
jgi:outer membrane lipoprotein-sorting protein